MNKTFYRYIGIALFSLLTFESYSQGKEKAVFEYISPVPNSLYHNPEASIILRSPMPVNKETIRQEIIMVSGNQSGAHPGMLSVANDGKTILFKSHSPFYLGETVNVTLGKGIQTMDGIDLTELSFQFAIRKSVQKPTIPEGFEFIGDLNEKPLKKTISDVNSVNAFNLIAQPFVKVLYSQNPAPGFLYTTLSVGDDNFLYISDNDGIPVYIKKLPMYLSNFQPNSDHTSTYYDMTLFAYIALDSMMNVVDTFRMGNGYKSDLHEFLLLENGHHFMISYDTQIMDLSQLVVGGKVSASVSGIVIQELDAYNNVIFEWRSWDHLSILDTYKNLKSSYVDYVHCNSIYPDTDSSLILSFRHFNEICRINKNTGEFIWRMGGKNNQFRFLNDDRGFSFQHTSKLQPNGNLTLYDNGPGLAPLYSRGLEYSIDEKNKELTLVREYLHDPPVYSASQGNFLRLENNNSLIYWGLTNPDKGLLISEYDSLSQLTFEARMYETRAPYRVYKSPWAPAQQIFSISDSAINFPATDSGKTSSYSFRLKNNSKKEVNLTYALTKDSSFFLYQKPPVTIRPGYEGSFNLVFAPKKTGNFADRMIFCVETDSSLVTKKVFLNATAFSPTKVRDVKTEQLQIFPNPCPNTLHVKSTKIVTNHYLSGTDGKTLYSNSVPSLEFAIEMESLPRACYFLTIIFADKQVTRSKIIKI